MWRGVSKGCIDIDRCLGRMDEGVKDPEALETQEATVQR